jgi:hypothetical protein
MFFKDGSVKKELLKIISLYGKTRGEDIFQSFYAIPLETNVSIYKLVSITMTNKNAVLTGLHKKISAFPDFSVTTTSFICKLYVQK